MQKPYYSFVVTSRNDGHGGNIMKRMQLFVRGLLHQSKRYKLPCELIFVEWNPPADRPLLHEVLPGPGPDDLLTIRYIQVPERLHKTYKRAQEIPLFQMIAKNVGIRRAKGEYILCTNIDLLFSDALFEILAAKQLDKEAYYRANRVDVPDSIEMDWSWERQMEFCKKNVIRRHGWDARFPWVNLEEMNKQNAPYPVKVALNILGWLRCQPLPKGTREYYLLDMMACGDFTLMHRDAWIDIGGYVELDLYSIHVDSMGLIAARAAGYRQEIFPPKACTYHIDHSQGWSSMTPFEKLKFMEERPGIGYGVLWQAGTYALGDEVHRMDLNEENWGFADEELEEIMITGKEPVKA